MRRPTRFTSVALGEHLGVSYQQVQKYERIGLLAEKGVTDLLDAYVAIPNADLRKLVIDLARALSAR